MQLLFFVVYMKTMFAKQLFGFISNNIVQKMRNTHAAILLRASGIIKCSLNISKKMLFNLFKTCYLSTPNSAQYIQYHKFTISFKDEIFLCLISERIGLFWLVYQIYTGTLSRYVSYTLLLRKPHDISCPQSYISTFHNLSWCPSVNLNQS